MQLVYDWNGKRGRFSRSGLGLACDIELIAPDQINEAYARLEKSDVRYRFVLDMARI